ARRATIRLTWGGRGGANVGTFCSRMRDRNIATLGACRGQAPYGRSSGPAAIQTHHWRGRGGDWRRRRSRRGCRLLPASLPCRNVGRRRGGRPCFALVVQPGIGQLSAVAAQKPAVMGHIPTCSAVGL